MLKILSRLGMKRKAVKNGPLLYGDRTPLMERRASAPVTMTSPGAIRTRGPVQTRELGTTDVSFATIVLTSYCGPSVWVGGGGKLLDSRRKGGTATPIHLRI